MPHFSIEAACSLEPGYSRIDSEVRGSAGYITSNVVQLGAHVRSRVFILIPAVLSMLYLASLQTRAVPTRRMLLTDLPGLSRAPILENVRPLRVLLATNAIVRIFYEPMHQLVGWQSIGNPRFEHLDVCCNYLSVRKKQLSSGEVVSE